MQRGSIAAAFGAATAAIFLLAQHATGAPCSLVVVGCTDGNMYALNAADGRMVWLQHARNGPSVEYGYQSEAAFAYINGTAAVVAGSGNGFLYTLDADTGTVQSQWKQPNITPCCYMCGPPCADGFTSPTVVDGVVFVGTIGSSGELYAVDAASGNLKWNTSSMQSDVFGPPRVFEGSIIVTGGTGSSSSIRSFDRVTGAEVWHYGATGEMEALQLFNDTNTTTAPAATASPDACYDALKAVCAKDRGNPVNCGMCANANAAKLLQAGCDIVEIDAWCGGKPAPSPTPPTPPLLIAGGVGGLIALDARSGKLVWTAVSPPPQPNNHGGYVGDITVSNGTVYFGCWDGYVYAVDARQGTLRWRFKTDASPNIHGTVQSAPAVAPDGAIFFGDVSGTMYGLESSGVQRWKNEHAGLAFDSSPVFSEGRVIIGDDANKVSAFDANSGRKIWSFGTGDAVTSPPIVIQLNNCPPPPPPPPPPPTPTPLVCNPALGKPGCNSTLNGCCPIHGGPFYVCKACCNSSVPDGEACLKCLETRC